MNKKITRVIIGVLILAIVAVLIWYGVIEKNSEKNAYADGISMSDLNTIVLDGSGVEVNFSEVILSKQQETRKLIVTTQTGEVSTQLTDRLINSLDFDILKKTQQVHYQGTGYFVVDLDNLTAENVIDDKDNKELTILIDHAYLQAIDIDPNNIIIDNVKEGWFARGDIELSLRDYNTIEKELRTRLEEKFNTAENGQEADTIALAMVKEVYEPIVKAIDKKYSVDVRFK